MQAIIRQAGRLRGLGLVGDERLQPRAHRALPDHGPARRPLRPQARLHARPRAVHRRLAAVRPRRRASTRWSPGAWCRRSAPRPSCPRRWPCCCRRSPSGRQGFAAGLFGAAQLARRRRRPGARRRARLVLGLAGGLLVQPAGRDRSASSSRSRSRAACARRAPARPSTGPASASSAPASSASRWRSSRATTGAGPRRADPRPLRRRRRAPRSSGCGGSCAPPPPCSTCASSATAPSPRPPAADHDRRHRDDGHHVHARDLHDRDDGLHASSRPGSRSPPCRSPCMVLTPLAGWLADRIGPRWLGRDRRPRRPPPASSPSGTSRAPRR